MEKEKRQALEIYLPPKFRMKKTKISNKLVQNHLNNDDQQKTEAEIPPNLQKNIIKLKKNVPFNCCEEENIDEKSIKNKKNLKNHETNSFSKNETSQAEKRDFLANEFLSQQVPYIDSHCHTDFIFNRLRCRNNEGLSKWLLKYSNSFPRSFKGCIANFIDPNLFIETKINTYNINWIIKEIETCQFYLGTSWGCHPHYAEEWANNSNFWQKLEEILKNCKKFKIVGVGECGIDLHRCESSLKSQQETFRKHIQLAFKYDLALIIHCRSGNKGNAENYCLEILEKEMKKPEHHKYLRIHRHCYTENWKNAEKWIKICPNIVFGFTPVVFSFSPQQIEAVRNLPTDRILIETDSPYFKPKPLETFSPQRVSLPGMASFTAFQIAKFKNLPVEEVLRCTFFNTQRIYNLSV